MSNDKPLAPLTAGVASAALVLALAASPAAADTFAEWGDGNIPKNSYGECWQATDGIPPTPECGGVVDSDGDGVMDDEDRCPGTPTGVRVDASGCPLDSDGDGVPDYLDQCPGTPAGAPVDAEGCPLDSDGDGVADYRDQCPGTPAGAEVDADGCIAELTIPNIYFDFDQATLKPQFKELLEGVYRDYRQVDIERMIITGHTDSVGPEAYNQGLSERRAAAVAEYLVELGVPSDKILARGKGESEPVAENDTKAGRAANRRVHIEVRR